MRLINADALIAHIKKRLRNEMVIAWMCRIIGEVPIIEAEPVNHGRWEEIQYYPVTRTLEATCSHCKVRGKIRSGGNQCGFLVPDSKRCPNCGAKMDLEETK